MRRLFVGITAIALGCGTPKAPVPAEDLIGRPPPPSEDPFFFVAMEKAIPVETSGRVEPVKTEVIEDVPDAKTRLSPDGFEDRERSLIDREKRVVVAEQRLVEAEQRFAAAQLRFKETEQQSLSMLNRRETELNEREAFIRADFDRLGQERAELTTMRIALESRPTAETAKKVEKKPEPKIEGGYQCMSCVAICEVVNGKQVCPEREDLICGWGTHTDRNIAGKLAEAECAGALKLTANMQTYGKIEGDCPRASCQK